MKTLLNDIAAVIKNSIGFIRGSRLAKTLLIIIAIKFLIFYGFLKGFLYPRYLKPKWESQEHRRDAVIDDLLTKPNTFIYDRIH